MDNPLRFIVAAILLLLATWTVVMSSVSQLAGKMLRLQLAGDAHTLRDLLCDAVGEPANRGRIAAALRLDPFLIVLYWLGVTGTATLGVHENSVASCILAGVIAAAITATAVLDAQQNKVLRALAGRERCTFTEEDASRLRQPSQLKWCCWAVALVCLGVLLVRSMHCSPWMRTAGDVAAGCGAFALVGLPRTAPRWPILVAIGALIAFALPIAVFGLVQGCR